MVTFVVIAVLGVVLLLGSLILDGVLDVFDADFAGSGVFSGASVGGFISGIGLGGIMGTSQDWGVTASLALGLFIGFALAYAAVSAYRLLKQSEPDQAVMEVGQISGTIGVVTSGSAPGRQALVRATYLGSPRTLAAYSAYELAVGQRVVITDVLNTEAVRVQPLPESGQSTAVERF
jgi:hypothetical protein